MRLISYLAYTWYEDRLYMAYLYISHV